jgi:uncharacterized phiE125 gp8 family phage protein
MWTEIQVVVPPINEPVEIEDLKIHCRLILPGQADDGGQDEQLQRAIKAARERCEGFCRRSLITQTLDIWWDEWDGPGVIDRIPRGPVQDVVGIYIYDYTGAEITIDSATYSTVRNAVVLTELPYNMRLLRGTRIRVISGFGDDPEDIPESLREGILSYASMLYENRLGEGQETRYAAQASRGGVPQAVYDLWRPWMIIS